MRKLIVLEHFSIDGVIQAPGGPDEDTSGGFAYGGWEAPYSDAVLGTAVRRQMNLPFDLLLGRKTFEIWASFWLMIYPLTLGAGKRLFAGGTIPMAYKVTESTVTPSGVIVVNYERAHLPLRAVQGGQ